MWALCSMDHGKDLGLSTFLRGMFMEGSGAIIKCLGLVHICFVTAISILVMFTKDSNMAGENTLITLVVSMKVSGAMIKNMALAPLFPLINPKLMKDTGIMESNKVMEPLNVVMETNFKDLLLMV